LAGDRTGRGNEVQRINAIMLGLKDIAGALDVPVIVISQLNREVEKRADKMPQLADLRQSGQIEQVANQVLLLMRPEYYIQKGEQVELKNPEDDKGVAYVKIAKARNGPEGIVRLHWDSQRMRFGDLAIERTELNT